MTPIPELLDRDRFANHLGVRLVEHSDDHVVVELEVAPNHLDDGGHVSAGALFSLADCAMSLISNAPGTAVAIATHFTMQTGGSAGSIVRAEARERLPSDSPAVTWEASVSSGGAVIATFTGTTLRLG